MFSFLIYSEFNSYIALSQNKMRVHFTTCCNCIIMFVTNKEFRIKNVPGYGIAP